MNKRTIFIIVGISIVFLLIAVWVYLMFFASPQTTTTDGDTPANFDFGDTTDPNAPNPGAQQPTTEDVPLIDVADGKRLRQLTTRPVAGYVEMFRGTSTNPIIRYAESGTGHVFDIDLETGEEIRVGATTIPGTHTVTFSPDGNRIALHTGFNGTERFVIGTLSSSSEQYPVTDIPIQPTAFKLLDATLLVSYQTVNRTEVEAIDPNTTERTTLFTVPFREATIAWGTAVDGPHVAFPKPAKQLEGFLLRYENGIVTRTDLHGFGVSGFPTDNQIIATARNNSLYRSAVITDEVSFLPIITLPEKCGYLPASTILICGHDFAMRTENLPDAWYSGAQQFSDSLWSVDIIAGSARNLINLEAESGRPIDTYRVLVGANRGFIYFTNRIDGSLWLYETEPFDA